MKRLLLFAALLLAPLAALRAAEPDPAAFVRIEQDSGVWWFRSPAGKRFLSIGANHVEPLYWQSPRNADFVRETYGPQLFAADGSFEDGSPPVEKWAERVAARFKDWGFNTFGFHNPLAGSLHRASGAYYVVHLPLPVPWGWNMKRTDLVSAFGKRSMDIFDGHFRQELEELAARLVKPRAEDPRVLGYAYTDGPPWTVADDSGSPAFAKLTPAQKNLHPWVHALMSLPATAPGKQAWLALMKERHPASVAAAVYAVEADSWDDLAARTEWNTIGDREAAVADSRAFLAALMRRWYEERARAIRLHDRHHLILGDKLNMNRDRKFPQQMAECLRVMRDHVDLISVQYYAPADEQVETLAAVHRESGRPVMNGDTACLPLWPDSSMRETDDFYRVLGGHYEETLTKLFSQPWFIGWHHCGYMRGLRQPYLAALKRGDADEIRRFEQGGRIYREGFVTDREEPIEAIVAPLRAAVSRAEELHRGGGHPNRTEK
jgi:hypothetical protein